MLQFSTVLYTVEYSDHLYRPVLSVILWEKHGPDSDIFFFVTVSIVIYTTIILGKQPHLNVWAMCSVCNYIVRIDGVSHFSLVLNSLS